MVRSEEEKETYQEQMAMSTTNAMLSGYNQAQEAAMMVSAFSHVLARDPTGSAEPPVWQWQTTGLPYDMPSASASASASSSTSHLFGGEMNYYHQGHVYHQGIYLDMFIYLSLSINIT